MTNAKDIWFCPSNKVERQWAATEPDYAANVRRYDEKGLFARQAWGHGEQELFKAVRTTDPTNVMMFFDSFTNWNVQDGTWWCHLIDFRDSGFEPLPEKGLAPTSSEGGAAPIHALRISQLSTPRQFDCDGFESPTGSWHTSPGQRPGENRFKGGRLTAGGRPVGNACRIDAGCRSRARL